MLLEARCPPLHLAWIADNMHASTRADLVLALTTLDSCAVMFKAKRQEYLRDVVYLACRLRHQLMTELQRHNNNNYTATPWTSARGPCEAEELDQLAVHIAQTGAKEETTALYCYTLARNAAKVITTKSIPDANTRILRHVLEGYGADSKFQRTQDLYIWTILRLRCPPWTCSALAHSDLPFAIASRVHTVDTNTIVHPLLTTSVSKHLHDLQGNELFCVMATIALEITAGSKTDLAINAQILTTDPAKPTLAAINAPFEIDGISDVCGYMYQNVLYVASSPAQAVLSWVKAYKPTGHLAKIIDESTATDLDNPLQKFVK